MRKYDRIVMIGHAYVGKTEFLAKCIVEDTELSQDYQIIFSDWYIYRYGFVDALYKLIPHLTSKYIVEGILGIRLLRKLVQESVNLFLEPNCIIWLKKDISNMRLPITKAMYDKTTKGRRKIWQDYVLLKNYNIPDTYTLQLDDPLRTLKKLD